MSLMIEVIVVASIPFAGVICAAFWWFFPLNQQLMELIRYSVEYQPDGWEFYNDGFASGFVNGPAGIGVMEKDCVVVRVNPGGMCLSPRDSRTVKRMLRSVITNRMKDAIIMKVLEC